MLLREAQARCVGLAMSARRSSTTGLLGGKIIRRESTVSRENACTVPRASLHVLYVWPTPPILGIIKKEGAEEEELQQGC